MLLAVTLQGNGKHNAIGTGTTTNEYHYTFSVAKRSFNVCRGTILRENDSTAVVFIYA